MGQQVVTELVIDSDTAGADRFSQAMAGAQQAADNGMSSVTGLNIGFIALGTGAAAALVGVKGLLDYVASANKGLADMQTVAHQVGLTLTDFQGVQFGGAIKGLSTDQVNAGLEKSAALLNDASRNSNSLSKELEANGLSVKNANGQLITENQLLGIASNLIKNANNPGDQLAIAQMLGFTKEWIPLLEQGAGAMSGLAAEAKAAGAIIDDETINKATEFDAQWRKSSVEFSTYMKAALSGLLPYIDDLITKTQEWIKTLPGKDEIEKHANDQLNALSDPIGGPNNDRAVGLHIDITPEAKAAADEISNATGLLDGFVKVLGVFAANKPIANLSGFSEDAKWFDGTGKAIQDTSGVQNTASWLSQGNSLRGLQDNVATSQFGGGSKVASRDTSEANDAVDRAINTLRRHTEQQIADTKAVGLGDAALAGFKATASETAAVQANGGKETAAQTAEFAKQRDAAIAAADALAKAKVASQIDFNSKTSLLSPEDVAIATQLKGIYGNDVPKALASTEAAATRANNAIKDSSTAFQNAAGPALVDFETGTKKGSDAIKAFETQFVRSLLTMANQALLFGPILRAFGVGSISGATPAIGTAGSAFLGPVAPSAHGNVFAGGNIIPFAQGGVVDSPTIAPMALFGESGPEAIVPLRRGSDGNLGIASSGGGGGDINNIYHIDASGADSGTVERIKRVLSEHSKRLVAQGKAMSSAQSMQSFGVS